MCAIINAVNYASAVNLGSVPDWVAALGTIASVLFIGVGLIREIKRRRLDDEQVATERRDAEAAQARLVTNTLVINPDMRNVDVIIANASNAPVFGVASTIVIRPLNGGLERRIALQLRNTQIAPHSQAPQGGVMLDEADRVADDESNVGLDVEFTDVHGRRWRRRGDEQPMRVFDQG